MYHVIHCTENRKFPDYSIYSKHKMSNYSGHIDKVIHTYLDPDTESDDVFDPLPYFDEAEGWAFTDNAYIIKGSHLYRFSVEDLPGTNIPTKYSSTEEYYNDNKDTIPSTIFGTVIASFETEEELKDNKDYLKTLIDNLPKTHPELFL